MASTLPIPMHDSFHVPDNRVPEESQRETSDEAKWALIERVLQSKGFRKSQRPSDFLLYVCKKALTGQGDDLAEQDIGEHVFSRKEGFDPGLDNIVRVTARRVRQKLDEFYAGEGRGESVVLSIPVGGYIPRFELRDSLAFEPASDPEVVGRTVVLPSKPSAEAKSRAVPLSWIMASVAMVLVALGAVAGWRYRAYEAALNLPANAMWSTLLGAGNRSIFVPGDSALVLL
jgi:hypothetical protein